MARYKQLCPPESLRITEEGEECTIELEWSYTEQPGPPMLVGITLAFLLELGRRGQVNRSQQSSLNFHMKWAMYRRLKIISVAVSKLEQSVTG